MEILAVHPSFTEKKKRRDLTKLYRVLLPEGSFLNGDGNEFNDGIYRYTKGEAQKKANAFGGRAVFYNEYNFVISEVRNMYFVGTEHSYAIAGDEIEKELNALYTLNQK